MKCAKIMTRDKLEDIMTRLNGCRALLYLPYESAGVSVISEDTINANQE